MNKTRAITSTTVSKERGQRTIEQTELAGKAEILPQRHPGREATNRGGFAFSFPPGRRGAEGRPWVLARLLFAFVSV